MVVAEAAWMLGVMARNPDLLSYRDWMKLRCIMCSIIALYSSEV